MKKNNQMISALATPNTLGTKAALVISNSLNPLVADAFALYIKTKNFHWHLSGPHFRDYHLLFDEQADQIFAMIDVLAERTRKLGGTTIRSVSHVSKLQTIKDNNQEYVTPQAMLAELMEDNKNYAQRMRDSHEICEKHKDVATASFLEIFIDETERRTWFLYEASISN